MQGLGALGSRMMGLTKKTFEGSLCSLKTQGRWRGRSCPPPPPHLQTQCSHDRFFQKNSMLEASLSGTSIGTYLKTIYRGLAPAMYRTLSYLWEVPVCRYLSTSVDPVDRAGVHPPEDRRLWVGVYTCFDRPLQSRYLSSRERRLLSKHYVSL